MPHNPDDPSDTNHTKIPGLTTLPGQKTTLQIAQDLADSATDDIVEAGKEFYFSNTRGGYGGGAGSLPEPIMIGGEGLDAEIYRILGNEQMRDQVAKNLYRDRSIYNTAGMDSDSTVVTGIISSIEKYKQSDDYNKVAWLDWLDNRAKSGRALPSEDERGGRYTGPVRSIDSTVMDDRDVEITLNDFATDMLGRNLTNKELKKYSSRFKKQDALPQVSLRTPNGPGQVTSVTQERQSRDSIVQDILQENPDYAKNVINTDVLDMFKRRLGI